MSHIAFGNFINDNARIVEAVVALTDTIATLKTLGNYVYVCVCVCENDTIIFRITLIKNNTYEHSV